MAPRLPDAVETPALRPNEADNHTDQHHHTVSEPPPRTESNKDMDSVAVIEPAWVDDSGEECSGSPSTASPASPRSPTQNLEEAHLAVQGARSGRQSMVTRSSGNRKTQATRSRKVRFEDGGEKITRAEGLSKTRCLQAMVHTFASPLSMLQTFQEIWVKYSFRELAIMSSLCELWSMGVWLAFIVEESMADVLLVINRIDMVALGLYLVDKLLHLLEDCSMGKRTSGENGKRQEDGKDHHASHSFFGWRSRCDFDLLKTCTQVILAAGMYPLQFRLRDMLLAREYPVWEVTSLLAIRLSRVAWAVKDCMRFMKRLELQVYVNVRMHGSEGSWRVILKQFLIVMFFGHWFGCLAFALKGFGRWLLQGTRVGNDSARDYFEKFSDDGEVPYQVGVSFGESYLLALYRGFNLNLEDLLPERPDVVILEIMASILVVLMKSYCIGSFFKHHQSREAEKQKFKDLIALATSYIELYQLPPSLRKSVLNYFEFMHAKETQRTTLEVLSRLPPEVQKKLKEHEHLPIVRDRNMSLFVGASHDFCMDLVMMLSHHFLQPGEIIFLEGEAPRALSFLDVGTVSLSRRLEQSEGKATEQLIRYLRADRQDDPTVIGEAAMIFGRAHLYSARVRAGVEVTLLSASRAGLEELFTQFASQHDVLVRNVAESWLLDIEGKDLNGREKTADQENETFVALQNEMRKMLAKRQEAQHAAFTFAAGAGDVNTMKELLAKRADVNTSDYDGRAPMHLAASEGKTEALEMLLTSHGDPNCKDRWGSTPMQDALKNGFYTAAKILMRYKGILDMADPAGALCTHAADGDTMRMQQLIEFRVDANMGDYDGRTALHLSACEGHVTVVTFLTARGANVNVKDRWDSTPMEDAVRSEFSTVARHLRAEGGTLNSEFAANLLCDAASTGNLLQLQMLNESGVDVNDGDYDRRTALHLAAAEGQPLAMNYLLFDANADPSPLDRWDATPLQDALASGDELCAPLLIMAGGVLGPSASEEDKDKVRKLRLEWFGNDGERYGGLARELRQKIGRHMGMVEAGRARSDMLELSCVVKFNRKLLHAQIQSLSPLSQDLRWLADLVNRLQCSLKSMKLLSDTIEAGVDFSKEARFWANTKQQNNENQGDKKKGGGKQKDVHRYVFDTVFLQSMKIAPTLLAIADYVTDRLVEHANSLKEGLELPAIAPHLQALDAGDSGAPRVADDGSQQPRRRSTQVALRGASPRGANEDADTMEIPSFSQLVVAEILKACGWSDEFGNEKRSGLSMSVTGSAEEQNLTAKVEKVAGVLLKGEHFHVDLMGNLLGEFRQQKQGVSGPVSVDSRMPSTKTSSDAKAYSFVSEWLERSNHVRLATGSMHDEDPPIAPPPGTPALAPYRPLIDGSNLCCERAIGNESLTDDTDMLTSQRKVLAQEAVLIALTALILDVWEADPNALGDDVEAEGQGFDLQKLLVKAAGAQPEGDDGNKTFDLRREDVAQLGRVFRETALACQGVSANEQDKLNRRAKKKKEMEKRKHTDNSEPVDRSNEVIEVVRDEGEEERPVDEQFPIQSAKILALQGKLSLEELALLVDMADAPQHIEEGKDPKTYDHHSTIFGPLTPERFVHNLLRWILGHDERQTELLESKLHDVQRQRDFADVAAGSAGDPLIPPTPMAASTSPTAQNSLTVFLSTQRTGRFSFDSENMSTETKWYQEVDKLQEENSNQSDDEGQYEDDLLEAQRRLMMNGQSQNIDDSDVPSSCDHSLKKKEDKKSKHGYRLMSITSIWDSNAGMEEGGTRRRRLCNWCAKLVKVPGLLFGSEGALRRQRKRVTKRFRELDEDGEGVGVGDVAQLLGVAFHHSITPEQQQNLAYRVFELLEKDETGGLVMLPELLGVLQKLSDELREQQRKGRAQKGLETGVLRTLTRMLSLLTVAPDTWWLRYWDLCKEIACIYYMVEVPIRFCFVSLDGYQGIMGHLLFGLNIFGDVFMVCNMVLHFFRGFTHPTRGIVTNFEEIRVHYVLNFFAIDALASFPWDLMVPREPPKGANSHDLFARPYATARLMKLLHMRNLFMKDWTRDASKRQPGETFHGAAAYMALVMLGVAHILACIWWVLGSRYHDFIPSYRAENNETVARVEASGWRRSWVYTYAHRADEPAFGDESGVVPFWWQYLISFYWCLGRITGNNSPGNLFPGSWVELGFTCVLFLLNVAVNGYCDGILVDKVIGGDEGVIEATAMRSIVDEYLQVVELSPALMSEVRASAEASAAVHQRRKMEEVGRNLPHPLRQRIARRIFMPYFQKSEIFTRLSNTFILELAVCCRFTTVGKDTRLSHIGDPVSELLTISYGRVAFENGAGKTLGETSMPGEMLAEVPFIFDMKHAADIIVLEESRLVSLARSEFVACCVIHPEDAMTLRREAVKFVEAQHGDTASASETERSTVRKSSAVGPEDAKSAVSSASRGSSGSQNTLRSSLAKLYLRDLAAVLEKSRQEEVAAHQAEVCKFVEFASIGDAKSVRAMLHQAVVQVDEGDYDARTAMHLACCNGHIEVVRELVEGHNASIWVKDRFGATPMDDAVREQQPEIARYLLQCGAQYQVDVGVAGQLCEAGYNNNIKLLHLLVVEVKVDPNCADYDSRTALHLAACEGHMEAAEMLLSLPGINVSPRDRLGNTPLDDAMRHRRNEMRRLLQEKGAEMGDRNVGVVLCTYGAENDIERLTDMVESCVPVNEGDYDARTSLHLAASNGCLEAATYLLKTAKANPNPLDRFLNTPLDDALRHNEETMAMLLRENGGLTGKDESMKQAVVEFEKFQEEQRVKKDRERLEREVKGSEVTTLLNGVRKLMEHATLEDDVYAFVTCTENFRVQMLHLLRGSLENESLDKTGRLAQYSVTKHLREQMLEQASVGLDSAGARLIATLEAEVLPWANKLTKHEKKLLHVLVPGLRETVGGLCEQLRVRSKLTGSLRKLSVDMGQFNQYACAPLGLMAYRMLDRNLFVLHQSRVKAAMMVWLCKAHSASPAVEKEKEKKLEEEEEEEAVPSEVQKEHRLGLSTGLQMILAEPACVPTRDDTEDLDDEPGTSKRANI